MFNEELSITAKFSKQDIENMIKAYCVKQGYEVISIRFSIEEENVDAGHQASIMGYNYTRLEFSGADVVLKKKDK